MKRIVLVPITTLLCAALALAGCQKKQAPAAAAPEGQGGETRGMIAPGGAGGQMAPGQMPPGHEPMAGTIVDAPPSTAPDAAAGVKWTMPKRWTLADDRPMRVATYVVPAAPGDAEGGECGVFYFGASQGGDVEANIARWVGQFEGASTPERTTREVRGLKVALVKVAGTYLSPGGPMMQSTGSRPGYALHGAIVTGPQGSVFFKLTGPKKTIDAARGDFDALVGSMKPE